MKNALAQHACIRHYVSAETRHTGSTGPGHVSVGSIGLRITLRYSTSPPQTVSRQEYYYHVILHRLLLMSDKPAENDSSLCAYPRLIISA